MLLLRCVVLLCFLFFFSLLLLLLLSFNHSLIYNLSFINFTKSLNFTFFFFAVCSLKLKRCLKCNAPIQQKSTAGVLNFHLTAIFTLAGK